MCFFFCFFFLPAALQRGEVAHAIAGDGLRGRHELRPLGLARVDVLAAALLMQLAAGLPDAVDAEAGGERCLDCRELALHEALRADHDCRLARIAAGAQHLLLKVAAAVADDALGLNDLGLGCRAREGGGCLAGLGALEQVAQPALVVRQRCQLGLLFVAPDVAPQALPVIGGQAGEEQRGRRVHRGPGAAVTAPVAVAVQRVGGVAAARADALVSRRAQKPGAVKRVLNAKCHFERVS